MKLTQLLENSDVLVEGVRLTEAKSYKLWENAGRVLKEAALTPDQIQKLFQQVEQGATDAGGNRTMLGKGKDAASAVNKAWEDLKTKIQDSGPIKNVDAAYDSAVAKIEAGLGGPDNAVNQVIQKYRAFAKAHPIAQGLIYSALIAAAGISGAGLGGAAVLGLLKMTDKLLQGEKFSSSVYQGGKTGAMAYAAGQIGQAMKGKPEAEVPTNQPGASLGVGKELPDGEQIVGLDSSNPNSGVTIQRPDGSTYSVSRDTAHAMTGQQGISPQSTGPVSQGASSDPMAGVKDAGTSSLRAGNATNMSDFSNTAGAATSTPPQGAGMSAEYLKKVISGEHPRPMIDAEKAQAALDWQAQNGGQLQQAASAASSASKGFDPEYLKKVISGEHPRPMISKEKAQELLNQMSGSNLKEQGIKLQEAQILRLFRIIDGLPVNEGMWDTIKGAAGNAIGAVANKAATVGKNLTTKITADKLMSAWKSAGSPTDSVEVKSFLKQQGVDATIIDPAMKAVGVVDTPAATNPTADPTGRIEPTLDPATAPAGASAPAAKAGKVGVPAGKDAVDQAVNAIKSVRSDRRQQVVQYAQTKFGAVKEEKFHSRFLGMDI